jgi:diadenosine tetraphosphate (Ap4A) HIT family hydrolase
MDYSKFLIKDYQYWKVYAAENQCYLGRCTIWCKRENANELTDVSDAELVEYVWIIKELKPALEKAFNADMINYAFLGNEIQHLHCHFIPRYSSSRHFASVIFTFGDSKGLRLNIKLLCYLQSSFFI